jgi:hypothetical protein
MCSNSSAVSPSGVPGLLHDGAHKIEEVRFESWEHEANGAAPGIWGRRSLQAIAKAAGVTGYATLDGESAHAVPTQSPGEEGSGGADAPRPLLQRPP